MLPFIYATIIHTLPAILIITLFFLIFDVSLRNSKTPNIPETKAEPNIEELEQKLQKLIENNNLNLKKDLLQQELKEAPTQTITSYLHTNKKDLKGFHLFQLIFSLINNGTEDQKIIKILHHYLPSVSTKHLYTLLKACKEFLHITTNDTQSKLLINDLKKNELKSTLIYLENKLNQTLNKVPLAPPAMQQLLIDEAVRYGLIFAAFCEFYNTKSTQKILQLSNMLSPQYFHYWHQAPEIENSFTKKRMIVPKAKHLYH